MPLQKLTFRPGVNREGTDYANEGGWYDCDKIRFRSGFPEKLGGWTKLSNNQYLGTCRSLWNWVDFDGENYLGVGTHLKYYIERGGAYYDITPIRKTTNPMSNNPFATAYNTLNGGIDATQTTLTLTSSTSFPVGGGIIKIGTEQMTYNLKSGSNLIGLVRGYNGTTAASHSTGAAVSCATLTVTDTANGSVNGDFVTYTGAATFAGISAAAINKEQEIVSIIDANTYTINVSDFSTSATSGGGAAVIAQYQVNVGLDVYVAGVGWGAGPWSRGTWGSGISGTATGSQIRLWTNDNYGNDLVFAPRGEAIYYWKDSYTVSTRGSALSELADTTTATTTTATFGSGVTSITVANALNITAGSVIVGTGIPTGTYVTTAYAGGTNVIPISAATTAGSSGTYTFSYAGRFVPNATLEVIASSIQRFIIALGANPYDPTDPETQFDKMVVRWSDQNNPYQWVPETTNQAGEFRLSHGSFIMSGQPTRQENLIWTDSALYSMQYLGPPYVWKFELLMDNISVMSPNSQITINNITYWMGKDKFYQYSGRVETLPCSLRQYIFNDINQNQAYQVFCGGNEGYNEVWWFYCSGTSNYVDKYVIYNYLDKVWYYGSMARTAWLDSGIRQYPMAADYNNRILNHESSVNDEAGASATPIVSYVQSSDFDIGDGHNFGFIWRILPDINFNGSNMNGAPTPYPSVTMTVKPRQNSGAPYGAAENPAVPSFDNYSTSRAYNIQEFDGQVYTRLRGRQMAFRIESDGLGVTWQLGTPRIDIRNDGRRGSG